MGKPKSYTPKDCEFSIQEMIAEINRELRMRRKVYPRQIQEQKLTSEEANRRWRKLKDTIRALELLDRIQMGKLQGDLGLGGQKKDGPRIQNKMEPE